MAIVREQSKDIDGILYTTKVLPASDGLSTMARLISMLGDAVVGLFFATDAGERDELMKDNQLIASLMTSVATSAAESESGGMTVLRDMLKTTKCDKISIGTTEVPGSVYDHFDDHFAARYKHLLEVCMWVGTVNFIKPSQEG